ncbi:MAG: 6-phosphogluconolactonase [Pseudomonadota bacterium]
MELRTYPDREMLAMGLAKTLSSALKNCLTVHDHASLCVPGGTSPGETFSILSGSDLDWSRVHVFLNDERWVHPDSDRSNTRLLRESFFVGRARRAVSIPMITDAATPEEGIPELTTYLTPELPISVLLLGMGTDMHTASLFPGADRLEEAMADDAPILVPMRAEGAGEPRVTLSRRVLATAMETHILIMGDEKRTVLERAGMADPMEAPIAAFLKDALVHWAP